MGIRYKTTINGKGKGRGQPRQAKARTAAGVCGRGGCCENAPEFGQTHDNRWSQGANRAVFRHAGRNEKNAPAKPQVRELRARGTPPCRIADHRLSSICLNLHPLFQQGGPPMQERINSFRFESRTCVEGRTPYPYQSSSRAAAEARSPAVVASAQPQEGEGARDHAPHPLRRTRSAAALRRHSSAPPTPNEHRTAKIASSPSPASPHRIKCTAWIFSHSYLQS